MLRGSEEENREGKLKKGDGRMPITILLIKAIATLYLIMALGLGLTKLRFFNKESTQPLSVITVYLLTPCLILSSFQIDFTREIRDGFLLALAAALLAHAIMILACAAMGRVRGIYLTKLEQACITYTNAGSLIFPVVISVLGKEYLIYSSAYVLVQLILIWSHGRFLIGGSDFSARNIFMNVNMISILAGLVLLLSGFRLPDLIENAVEQVAGMIGPMCMIITGIMLGLMNWKKIFIYRRLWLVMVLRLIIMPAIFLAVLKITGIGSLSPEGEKILLVVFLATLTSSSGGLTQMALVYGNEPEYATAINVTSTLLCAVTMPGLVWIYLDL